MMKTISSHFLTAAFALFIASDTPAQQTDRGKPIDDATLRVAASNAGEWLTYGRDYAETHFSPLKQIDTSNVSPLSLAWSSETESPSGGRIEATLLEANGILYGSLGRNVLFAVDAHTGKMKWRLDPEIRAPAHLRTLLRPGEARRRSLKGNG
jgi:quinohemoprotein ethanol dehydrogenase